MEDLKNNNSFEDQMSGLLSDFEAEPSSRVWDRIEHRLDDDRDGIKRFNKKLIIQWSIAASIVMGFVFASVNQLFFKSDVDNNLALNSTPEVILNQKQPNNFVDDQSIFVGDTLQKTLVKEQSKVLVAKVEESFESKVPVYDFQETIKKRNEQKVRGEEMQEPLFADNVQEKSNIEAVEPNVVLADIESSTNDVAPVLLALNENQENYPSYNNDNNAYLVNVRSLAQVFANSVQKMSKVNKNSNVVRYKFGLKNINVSGTYYK